MTEIIAKDWLDIQDKLFSKVDLWNPTLRRFRSPMVYRGLGRASHSLVPSLHRLGEGFEAREGHILRNFKKYAHRNVIEHNSDWHWLSVAQHHGLPTRLLDWTYSPYVALHFATAGLDDYTEDGVIWAVNFEQARQKLPETLYNALCDIGSNGFSVDLLDKLGVSPLELELNEVGGKLFALFFEPPSIDDRIVNQYALFSVLSRGGATFDDWLAENKDLWWKLVIPADLKWEIRDKLDQANITERVLFPGLAGLSAWLRRHYSSRPPLSQP